MAWYHPHVRPFDQVEKGLYGAIITTNSARETLLGLDTIEEHVLFVDDASLSRTHCQLEIEESACWVRDLNSRNGTFLSTQRVGRARLSEGDVLTIGQSRITYEGRDVSGELPAESRPETARWTERLFTGPVPAKSDAGGRDAERSSGVDRPRGERGR